MKRSQRNTYHTSRYARWSWCGLAFFCLCVISLPAGAIWLGQSQVNPYLELQEIYESNLYNAYTDEESVLITIISPGVHAEFPHSEEAPFRILGNYRANFKFYSKHGDDTLDPDEELNTIEHRFDAKMEARLASGFGFNTSYILDITSFPPGSARESRDKYLQHTFGAMAEYAFVDRYEIQFEYQGKVRSYDEEENEIYDNTQHDFNATFFYRLFPSLTLLGGGGYGMIGMEEPLSDSTVYRGYGGFRFDATERLIGQVKLGVISKDFTDDDFEDITTVYASGELDAQFTENTKLVATLNREVGDTSMNSLGSTSGEYYISTSLRGDLKHTLAVLPNMSVHGLVGVKNTHYPEDVNDRKDTLVEVGFGADYTFYKFLVLGAEYIYNHRSSSVDGYEYDSHRALLSVRGIL